MGDKPNSPAFGAFGSTDGLQVEIQNARFDPTTKQITGNARITIIDTFGLSNTDNDSPGQIAMWLLQHQRGCQPFIHQVQFDVLLDRAHAKAYRRRDPAYSLTLTGASERASLENTAVMAVFSNTVLSWMGHGELASPCSRV
jgi:hypothetical protein